MTKSASRSVRALRTLFRSSQLALPLLLGTLASLTASTVAEAHDFRPGVLAVVERAPASHGSYAVAWTEPVDSSGAPAGIEVVFPSHCRRTVPARVECGSAGMHGELSFRGMNVPRMKVVVVLRGLDGTSREWLLSGRTPRLVLDGAGLGNSATAWLRLGTEHVLLGPDHLAFLLGLLLVVGLGRPRRRLIATVSAFTLAHSITLALGALELLRLPRAPVEAAIAASVLLVAREATHTEPTLTRRAPWRIAMLFGLIHGLGFAGALRDLGLPKHATGWALLWFNVGVEAGQLVALALVAMAVACVQRLALSRPRLQRATGTWAPWMASYALGALGALWFIERTLAIISVT